MDANVCVLFDIIWYLLAPAGLTGQCYEIEKVGEDIIMACSAQICKIPESGIAECIQLPGAVPKIYYHAESHKLLYAYINVIYQTTIDNFTDVTFILRKWSSKRTLTREESTGTINDILSTSTEIIYTTSSGLWKYDLENGTQMLESGILALLDISNNLRKLSKSVLGG